MRIRTKYQVLNGNDFRGRQPLICQSRAYRAFGSFDPQDTHPDSHVSTKPNANASGRDDVSLTLAAPQISARKIYVNLAPVKGKKGRHVILWNLKDD
jgi:hypothetical protein